MPPIRRAAIALLLAAGVAQAQGSAVVTLVLPPPGGEGYSMLQSGGMFAEGATATYYNPALLADLQRNTGSQLHYTEGRQRLLPVLRIPDLFQEYWGVAAVFPDRTVGSDLGVGLFRNHVSFGENQQTDANGRVLSTTNAEETVYGAGIGVRLGLPISVGGAVKFIDSRLAEGFTSSSGAEVNGSAESWAFDLGVLANPRLSPPVSLGLPYMMAAPSMAVALQNMGPDIFYDDPRQSDPIPTSLAYGVGLQANACDFLDFETAWSTEREIHRRASWSPKPFWTAGASMGLLGFRYSVGWLEDDRGTRFERHSGTAIDVDLLRAFRVWRRLATGDFHSPPEVLEAGYPLRWTRIMGIPFRANPRLVIGRREIDDRRNGLREGQKARFIALSL